MKHAGATQIDEVCKVMHTPRSVDVDITAKCNLRCKYCYHFDNQEISYNDLPTEEWLQFFDELGRCAVMNICLAGGEPFIRDDLTELLDGIVHNRMRFSILSNGSLISDEIAAFIKNTRRCDYVQISIDGSIPEIHDSCRGEGSFVRAIQGIKRLQRHNVPVMVRVTIHHHNVHDLENIAQLLFENLKLNAFGTNSAGAFGSCHRNAKDVLLTTQDRVIAMKTLLRLSEKYKGQILASAGPLAEAIYWNKMEKARQRGELPFSNGGYLTSCGCATNKISVRSDGAGKD
jgi:SynChlorMet cassette radical SAM/SPASM protein ScmE